MPPSDTTRSCLIVVHVPWEGPHRIADAMSNAGFELDVRCRLDGDSLPEPEGVDAAVFMGGPMGARDDADFPGLVDERAWIVRAAARRVPMLGVCLGAQLIACALGGSVRPGEAPEIGWGPVEVRVPTDPLLQFLAPRAEVLHWHSDVIELPTGTTPLASSAQSRVQAFRVDNAWGLLFHAEADATLARVWLGEPSMRVEAERAQVDPDQIIARADELDSEIRQLSSPMFEAFARLASDSGRGGDETQPTGPAR